MGRKEGRKEWMNKVRWMMNKRLINIIWRRLGTLPGHINGQVPTIASSCFCSWVSLLLSRTSLAELELELEFELDLGNENLLLLLLWLDDDDDEKWFLRCCRWEWCLLPISQLDLGLDLQMLSSESVNAECFYIYLPLVCFQLLGFDVWWGYHNLLPLEEIILVDHFHNFSRSCNLINDMGRK